MTKPTVFNYQDYRDAIEKIKELEGNIIRLNLDNEYLSKRNSPHKATIKTRRFWMQEYDDYLYDYEVYCPECDMFICYPTEHEAHKNYQYCPRCGQKVYWEDDDE